MDKFNNPGKVLLIVTAILSVFGLLLLYSASRSISAVSGSLPVYMKQFVWLVFAILLFIALKNFDYRHWNKLAHLLYFITIILLLLVLAIGTGRAGRWIKIGWFNFQPSEFAKFVLIIVLARYFSIRDVQRFFNTSGWSFDNRYSFFAYSCST